MVPQSVLIRTDQLHRVEAECAQSVPDSSALSLIPVHSSARCAKQLLIARQGFPHTSAMWFPGLKILCSLRGVPTVSNQP